MPRAVWNGVVLAESDRTEIVEGNYYFPPDSINRQYFKQSETHTVCPWKGQANYFTIEVDGKTNKDGAWYYPTPTKAAEYVKDYVAFWRGVTVEKTTNASDNEAGEGLLTALKRFVNM